MATAVHLPTAHSVGQDPTGSPVRCDGAPSASDAILVPTPRRPAGGSGQNPAGSHVTKVGET
jgi:hypothetical protein